MKTSHPERTTGKPRRKNPPSVACLLATLTSIAALLAGLVVTYASPDTSGGVTLSTLPSPSLTSPLPEPTLPQTTPPSPSSSAAQPPPNPTDIHPSTTTTTAGGGGLEPAHPSATRQTTASSAEAAKATPAHTAGKAARFAPSSFFYQDISQAPLAANSDAIAANVLHQAETHYGQVGKPNLTINTTNYAPTFYHANASTPRTNVGFNNCQNKPSADAGLMQQLQGVPIPHGAVPSPGTDSQMAIYDRSSDTLWEMWVVKKTGSTYTACWGGKMTNVSTNSGIFPHPYGTTATGLSMFGGTIRAEELQAGRITHAIMIGIPQAQAWPKLSWPALRGDGHNPNNTPNVPRQGQRLRLDPALDLDSLRLNKVTYAVAQAAQRYGFIVSDTSGAVAISTENTVSLKYLGQTNPYPALFEGKQTYNVLEKFPWKHLQALPVDYGKP